MGQRSGALGVAGYLFVIFFVLIAADTSNGKVGSNPPWSLEGSRRGRGAVDTLADRLPVVARRYRKNSKQLEQLFLKNKDLWVDSCVNLLYSCTHLPQQTFTESTPDETIQNSIAPYDQTFRLHSLPGATKVIYLDFDGHTTTATLWNNGATIVSLPYGGDEYFTDTELDRIQNIWARVSEDFIIYNVDVTTEDPGIEALSNTGPADQYYGIRVVISPSSSWFGSYGGVAYIDSFNWNSDTPTFVFSNNLGNGNEKFVADATSHEVGHTLGLYHDGGGGDGEYYQGHGLWAPIMGVGYYKPITQWSKGEYPGANNTEDDLAIMSLVGGFDYRFDNCGNTIDSAKPLTGSEIASNGIIEKNTDMDVFSFNTGSGDISISAVPALPKGNVDMLLELLNPDGSVISATDEFSVSIKNLSANVTAGTYYIRIDGVGDVDYSDYASLGRYTLSGTIVDPNVINTPPVFSSDPIVQTDVALGTSCDGSIADTAGDLEDDPLTFSKVAGPEWLVVAPDGTLSGTPEQTDIGINNWIVEVNDSSGGADQATLEILVFQLITVLYPNGGQALSGGQKHTILWESTADITTVMLEYSADNGSSWLQIAANVPNTGRYDWTVPQINATQALIRVSGGGVSDISDTVFSIVWVPPPKTISGYVRSSDGTPITGVSISSDNGGTSAASNAAGFYSITVPSGWTGTVTPSKADQIFDPPSNLYSNVTVEKTYQNYIGSNLANHVFNAEIQQVWDYNDAANPDDLRYVFYVMLETDTAFNSIELLTPAGKNIRITNTPHTQTLNTRTWYYLDEVTGHYLWEYEGSFTDPAELNNFGDGNYVITLNYGTSSTAQTNIWFKIPNSTEPLPQPKQEPVLTFPANNSDVTSPVTFTWQQCNDVNADLIRLKLNKLTTGEVQELEFPVNAANSSAIELSEGLWETYLGFEHSYQYKNPDDIDVSVWKYSESISKFQIVAPPPEPVEVIYEAENATLSGLKVVSLHSGYTGTGFVDYLSPANDYIEWTVTVGSTVQAELQFAYALARGDRPLEIRVNGQVVEARLSFPATGSWSTWSTVSTSTTLNAGTNKIRAAAIGFSGANVDYLKVIAAQPEIDTPPEPEPQPTETTYEAESATLSGLKVLSLHSGYTGTGFADYLSPANDYIQWTVNVDSSTQAELRFRYALARGDRPLEIYVNGRVVESRLSFPATGGWSTWSTVSTTAALNTGINTVRAAAIGFSGANVDHLKIITNSHFK